MVTLVMAIVMAQPAPLRVTVIDISASDAIYEDVSRGLADEVVKALAAAGFEATRIDESELPEFPCQPGPCLAKVARDRKSHVLVTLDAKELDAVKIGVGLTGLAGHNGMPLAGARYTLKVNQKAVPKELTAFGVKLLKEATKVWRPAPPPDAGRADSGISDAGQRRSP